MTALTEKSRVYDFGTHKVELSEVRDLFISDSGNHRVTTEDGQLHIIRPGWYAIHIDDNGKDWTL